MFVRKTALHKALAEVLKVTDPRAADPTRAAVHLHAANNILTLTADNGDISLSGDIPCKGDIDCAVPCAVLRKLVKPASTKDAAELCIEDRNGAMAIACEGVTATLATLPLEDFPVKEDCEWTPLAVWLTRPLVHALDHVLPAVSTDPARPHISGVQFEEGRICATDGHRLHLTITGLPLKESQLLPLPAAKLLRRILGDTLVVARSDNYLRMRTGNWLLDCRLPDRQFPPVDQVIPRNPATHATVDAAVFARALRQVAGVSQQNTCVNLRINGVIEIVVTDPDIGESRAVVTPTSTNHTGNIVAIGMNSTYLLDALPGSGEVSINLDGPLDPVTFRSGSDLAVVMPMRI